MIPLWQYSECAIDLVYQSHVIANNMKLLDFGYTHCAALQEFRCNGVI